MSALSIFVNKENAMRKLFKREPFSIATHEDRQQIANRIDCDLSPESLTCDGELSGAQVMRRFRLLNSAARELAVIDPDVVFREADVS